jgi:amino acid transporter
MRVDLTMAIFADGFLLLVSLIIIGKVIGDGDFTLEPLSPTSAPGDFTGLSLAIAFGVLIFLGFEQSFVLGEETEDPHGNVPRAIYVSLALIGSVLFLATFALVLGFGLGGIDRLNELVGEEGTPWFALVRERVGDGWTDVLQVAVVFSIFSNLLASTNSVARIQYGMGRARALPAALGRTLPGPRTPHVALLLQTALTVVITLIAGLVWSPESLFAFLGFAIGFGAAVSFILIAIAGLFYFHRIRDQASSFRNYVVPAVSIVILLPVVYTSFYPNPGYPLKWAPWVVVGWLALGIVYLVIRSMRKQQIDLDYAFREAGEPVPPEALATEPRSP